jgi:hypothetical protein
MDVAGKGETDGGREHGRAEAATSSHAGAASCPRVRPESGADERERMPTEEQEESECVRESGEERVGAFVPVWTTVIYHYRMF